MSEIQKLLSAIVWHEHDAYDASRSFDDRVASRRQSVAAQVQIVAMVAALEAENAQLRAELSACIAGGNDYTGAILADDEAGMMLAANAGAQ